MEVRCVTFQLLIVPMISTSLKSLMHYMFFNNNYKVGFYLNKMINV